MCITHDVFLSGICEHTLNALLPLENEMVDIEGVFCFPDIRPKERQRIGKNLAEILHVGKDFVTINVSNFLKKLMISSAKIYSHDREKGDNMMEILLQLFAPEIASDRWQWLWNFCNLMCAVASTGILTMLYHRLGNRNAVIGPQVRNRKKTVIAVTLAVLTQFLVIASSQFLQRPDREFPFYTPLYSIVQFLDQFVFLENLFYAPVDSMPWCNMLVRCVGISAGLFVAVGIFRVSKELSDHFYSYLKEKFNGQNTSEFAKKLWDVLKKFGLVGTTATASVVIFASEKHREEINKILEWLYDFLSQITLLTQLPENATTFSELAYAFFVVVFSILIVAVYLFLIVAVASVANVLWNKRTDILSKLKKWFKEIGYIILTVALVLFVVLFSVLLATRSASFQDAITLFVEDSPRTVFVLLQHTVLILIGVGIVALMCCTLIALITFGFNFVKAWSQTIQVTDPESAKRFIKRFGPAVLSSIVVACFIFGYDPIRGWLVERFADDGGYGIWWIVMQIFSAMAAAVVITGGILVALYLIVYMGTMAMKQAMKVIEAKHAPSQDQKRRPLKDRILEYCRSLGETVFRIFKGYQTESQKNSAVYVAACFASLASLINTAMGLNDFNIPIILAIAMSFAVQLAMLIFGMKAGQGIAENIVSDVKQVGASLMVAIVRKLAVCMCYVLAFLAARYGICIASNQAELDLSLGNLLNAKENFLPVLLIWCAGLTFGYAVLKQLLEILVLFIRWAKHKIKCMRDPDAKASPVGAEQDDSGLVLSNPKRIPARYYLMAYLLFMIVSTGFAFTNLFGGYAEQVQLHTRVYDQVYSETEKKLELQDKAVQVVNAYQEQKQAVLKQLAESYDSLAAKNEQTMNALKAADALELAWRKSVAETERIYSAEEELRDYSGGVSGFSSFYESLVSFINREYDLLGEDMTIHVHEYSFAPNNRERYKTVVLVIESDGMAGNMTIGKAPDDMKYFVTKERLITNATKYTLLDELFAIYETYATTISEYTVTQYGHINYQDSELFTGYFTKQSSGGDPEDPTNGENGDNTNSEIVTTQLADPMEEISESLDRMEILDDVRRNVAELYFDAYPNAEKCVPMIDLPRIIDLYLSQEEADQAALEEKLQEQEDRPSETTEPPASTDPSEETSESANDATDPSEGDMETEPSAEQDASGKTEEQELPTNNAYDKQEAFQELSDYVDRSLQVYNILNVADSTLEKISDDDDEGQTQTQELNTNQTTTVEEDPSSAEKADDQEETPSDKAYRVRTYRSYARGIATSNFQISFDALLKGGFGLNGTQPTENQSPTIDALYSAQLVAAFILIICALVDFMAFFAGLLLFQDAFVLDIKRGSKLEKLGYVNFDAVLTQYFMPVEQKGTTRSHQIALIYYLINCRSRDTLDLELIGQMNVDSHGFTVRILRAKDFLKQYGLAADSADFHVWLTSLVQKNDIDFDEILN